MSQMLNMFIFLGVFLSVIIVIILLYNTFNLLYYMYKNKYNNSGSQYENKQIALYRSRLIFILPGIIFFGILMFWYYSPVGFDKVIGANKLGFQNLTINLLRSSEEISSDIPYGIVDIDEAEAAKFVNIFNGYRYIRSIQESRIGNTIASLGDVDFLTFTIANAGTYRAFTLTITSEGYIYDSLSGQAYKVLSKDKEELLNKLRACKRLGSNLKY